MRPHRDVGRVVRILVAEVEGSAPREAGAAMVVGPDAFWGTIGGGALELTAISAARSLLAHDGIVEWHRELRSYPLGPALGQCCGGMVRLLYEVGPVGSFAEAAERGARRDQPAGLVVRCVLSGTEPVVVHDRSFTAAWPLSVLRSVRQMLSGERPRQTLLISGGKQGPAFVIEPQPRTPHALYLYGAGHVGRAVVRALEGLPFAITWIDVAESRFPDVLTSGVRRVVSTDPSEVAARAPEGTLHLVMTFSHALDLAIVAAVLARTQAWVGLIGSATKRARFEKRLREAGFAEGMLKQLHCPIGIGIIRGKEPAMIAISVAAQLAAWATDGAGDSAQRIEQNR